MGSDNILLRTIGDGLSLTVFFPGWATDHRVFDDLDLPTNRLLPLEPFSQTVHSELAEYILVNELAPVNLMGWSLGGFIATEFARQFPELVSQLILCGVRIRYPGDQIEATRRGILDGGKRFLMSFYRQCFLPAQKEDYQRFRDELMPRYLKEMSIDYLLLSLDRLAQVEINADSMPVHPVCMIHGDQDIVAPTCEAVTIDENADNVRLNILPNAGHAAFLTAKSREIIRECLI